MTAAKASVQTASQQSKEAQRRHRTATDAVARRSTEESATQSRVAALVAKRHALFLTCRTERIAVPMARGTLDDVDAESRDVLDAKRDKENGGAVAGRGKDAEKEKRRARRGEASPKAPKSKRMRRRGDDKEDGENGEDEDEEEQEGRDEEDDEDEGAVRMAFTGLERGVLKRPEAEVLRSYEEQMAQIRLELEAITPNMRAVERFVPSFFFSFYCFLNRPYLNFS